MNMCCITRDRHVSDDFLRRHSVTDAATLPGNLNA
jgi:hypothetical protein